MATIRETLQQRKLRRNKQVLADYMQLKQHMTCRKAQPIIADRYNLSPATVRSILFDPNYSNSPLDKAIAMDNPNVMPV